MNILKYNPDYTIEANGLTNNGVICYFNSLLQSLFSCTSFIETILKIGYEQGLDKDLGHNQGSLASNELWQVLFYVCVKITDNNPIWNPNYSIAIFQMFIKELKKQKKPKFGLGQQDSMEALIKFIECLEMPNHKEISRLFQHRYRCYITCPKCNNKNETQDSIRMISFIDESESKKQNLINYLTSYNETCDENHVCSNCKYRGVKNLKYILTMIPEIFIISFNKYKKKWISNRPDNLEFAIDRKNNKFMKYELVSQIEHIGNTNSGHYWAQSLRLDGVHILNDSNTKYIKNFESGEPNVYVCFYHFNKII